MSDENLSYDGDHESLPAYALDIMTGFIGYMMKEFPDRREGVPGFNAKEDPKILARPFTMEVSRFLRDRPDLAAA